MGRSATVLLLLILVPAVGCGSTPTPDDGGGEGTGSTPGGAPAASGGTSAVPETPDTGTLEGLEFFGSAGADLIEDVIVFLGGERRPARSLAKIRDVHNLKNWTHRPDVPDAVETCRDAVRNLARSDYESWDETALVVSVVSTMASRDDSALVRADCIATLRWFRTWVHPDAEGIGPGVETKEADVIRALRVIDELGKESVPTGSQKFTVIDAISVLGSYPWDRFDRSSPRAVRARLSRPRGVIRRLTANDLSLWRRDPEIRDTLDRSLLRVTDALVLLTELAALGDRAPAVRAAAASALAETNDPRISDTLASVLAGETETLVLLELIPTLGALAADYPSVRQAAIPTLAAALTSPEESVRRAAARELPRVTGEDHGPTPVDWQRWWREHRREYIEE